MKISIAVKRTPVIPDPVNATFTATDLTDDGSWSQGGSNYWSNRQDQLVDYTYSSWFRFPNITVPAGATIVEAYLRLFNITYAVSNRIIYVQVVNEDSPTYPTSSAAAKTLFGRSLSAHSWTINASVDSWVNTVDISSSLNTVISRPGWNSGNAMMFALSTITDWQDPQSAYARFASYENTTFPTNNPELYISWLEP